MKKYLSLAALLLLVLTGRTQSFEGSIRWAMKMEITDPAMKAKMEEGQKKMNDPANQAKMKEMEAKMNDPQMKAMMDANPQMKAQMETAMKMMQGGDMNSAMSSTMLVKIKGGNSLTKMEGGMMDKMEVLYLKDKNQSVRIDHANKSYSILPSGSGGKTAPEVKVTKTSETKKILGYNCTKFIAETTSPMGKPSQQFFWTTTEIKDLDLKALAHQRMARGTPFFYDNIEGIPLRIEMTSPEGSMTMEVTEVTPGTLSASDFQIPAGYKETKGMGF